MVENKFGSWKHTSSAIDFWTEVKEFKVSANRYIFRDIG